MWVRAALAALGCLIALIVGDELVDGRPIAKADGRVMGISFPIQVVQATNQPDKNLALADLCGFQGNGVAIFNRMEGMGDVWKQRMGRAIHCRWNFRHALIWHGDFNDELSAKIDGCRLASVYNNGLGVDVVGVSRVVVCVCVESHPWPQSVNGSFRITLSGPSGFLSDSDRRLHVARLLSGVSLNQLHLSFAGLPQFVGGPPEGAREYRQHDGKAGDELLFISVQEIEQASETESNERNERARKKGAVTLLTIVSGCVIAWLIARREPRNRALKKQPEANEK